MVTEILKNYTAMQPKKGALMRPLMSERKKFGKYFIVALFEITLFLLLVLMFGMLLVLMFGMFIVLVSEGCYTILTTSPT